MVSVKKLTATKAPQPFVKIIINNLTGGCFSELRKSNRFWRNYFKGCVIKGTIKDFSKENNLKEKQFYYRRWLHKNHTEISEADGGTEKYTYDYKE